MLVIPWGGYMRWIRKDGYKDLETLSSPSTFGTLGAEIIVKGFSGGAKGSTLIRLKAQLAKQDAEWACISLQFRSPPSLQVVFMGPYSRIISRLASHYVRLPQVMLLGSWEVGNTPNIHELQRYHNVARQYQGISS